MYALEINQLSKTYPNGFEALKGINLAVQKGDFFALLGANGAGKSTTIGLITNLLTKTTGSISIYGHNMATNPTSAKFCLGLVPQEVNLNIFETCEQVLRGQAGYYGLSYKIAQPQIEQLLQKLGLWEKRKTLVRHLSGGMKRRLMIARALVHQPKLLILDEPTAGVDVELRHHMWDFLTQTNLNGTTIILTTHYLEEAEKLCKNVAIIDQGQIIKHSSMQDLLHTVQHRTYILTLVSPQENLPCFINISHKKITDFSFELRMANHLTLNELFFELNRHQISISSIQNKTNGLEELFLDLIRV